METSSLLIETHKSSSIKAVELTKENLLLDPMSFIQSYFTQHPEELSQPSSQIGSQDSTKAPTSSQNSSEKQNTFPHFVSKLLKLNELDEDAKIK